MFKKKKKIYYILLDYYYVLVVDLKKKKYVKLDRSYFFLNYNIDYEYIEIDKSFNDTIWR